MYFEVKPFTRLGNWLFQYATAMALSDDVVCYVERPEQAKGLAAYPEFFSGLPIVWNIPVGIQTYKEPYFQYSPIPAGIAERGGLISGFFQSAKYFNHARGKILATYKHDVQRIDALREKYRDILSMPDITAIHVRRGDYLNNMWMHPFVGETYFKKAVSKLCNVKHFLVCSDDIEWCRRFFPKTFPGKEFYFSDADSAVDDLFLQTLCKNNIISNSSFSWWGAWLNENPEKKVVAPSMWFGYRMDRGSWCDIYDDGWVVIENRYTPGAWLRAHLQYWWRRFKLWAYPLLKELVRII